MDFSSALTALKNDFRVARAGWNGMWLVLVKDADLDNGPSSVIGMEFLPWIGMKTADNTFVPWLCSQTDMLADDWEHVQ